MKKINFNEVIKEIIILTAAVAIIAAAVYFFLVPSCQQYFGSGNCAFQFCAAAVIGDYHDFECGAADHRIFDMRQGIWYKNGLYKHYAAGFYRYF